MHPETSHHGFRARGGCQQRRGPPVDPNLLAAGHTVTGLARDASRLAAFEHERFHAVIGDALDQTVLQDAVAQASAEEPVSMVAHLVGPSSSDRLTP